jgi:hypothetical protein
MVRAQIVRHSFHALHIISQKNSFSFNINYTNSQDETSFTINNEIKNIFIFGSRSIYILKESFEFHFPYIQPPYLVVNFNISNTLDKRTLVRIVVKGQHIC